MARLDPAIHAVRRIEGARKRQKTQRLPSLAMGHAKAEAAFAGAAAWMAGTSPAVTTGGLSAIGVKAPTNS
jgi:hypothetical protein